MVRSMRRMVAKGFYGATGMIVAYSGVQTKLLLPLHVTDRDAQQIRAPAFDFLFRRLIFNKNKKIYIVKI